MCIKHHFDLSVTFTPWYDHCGDDGNIKNCVKEGLIPLFADFNVIPTKYYLEHDVSDYIIYVVIKYFCSY